MTMPHRPDTEPRTGPRSATLARTGLLIDRCLAGDGVAWEHLYAEIQPQLMVIARAAVGVQSSDANLVDEIVARVWFSLIDRGYRNLRKFDQSKGIRLTTYLSALARNEWLQYCRAERRRSRREYRFAERSRRESEPKTSTLTDRYSEFRDLLTPKERDMWDHLIGSTGAPSVAGLSQANIWKLKQRIREKLFKYAEFSDPGK